MKKILSVLATLVLLGQSAMTSVVYAQEAIDEGSTPETAVESVVEESNPDNGGEDVSPVVEEVTVEETVAEPEVLEETVADEELASEPETEVLDEEPAVETTEEENVEEPADVVEPVEEPEVPAIVEEPVAETPVEEETVTESEELSAIAMVVETVLEREPLTGWAGGIYVTVEDPLGGLPEGVKMVLTPVEEEDVFDLIDSSLDAKVAKVVAVDITFYLDGEEVEPTQPINVKMVAGNMPEAQTVVHIDDKNNVEEIDADISGRVVEFEAESFSIYAIVTYPVLTVNFYNGEKLIETIYVKSTSEILGIEGSGSLIFDPGVGELNELEVFRGWIAEGSEELKTIDAVRNYLATEFPDLIKQENPKINFAAKILNRFSVTYQDEDGVVFAIDENFTDRGVTQYEYKVSRTYEPKNKDSKFTGWRVDGIENLYQKDDLITITGDLILCADVIAGHWLVFDENGKGATYNAPQFVKSEAVTERPIPDEEMQLQGYEFDDWYMGTGRDAKKFKFGEKLSETTTIYAKWIAKEVASYTVLIRKQNVAGDGYDFVESTVVENAAVGSVPTAVNTTNGKVDGATYNGEVGFSFTGTDQASKTVATEGNTVVNVYYDRNTIKFIFNTYGYTYTIYNGTSNGNYYISNGNGGYDQVYLYHHEGKWYKKRTGNRGSYKYSDEYVGTLYIRGSQSWKEYERMEGLYGSTLADNEYEWPTEYDWYSEGSYNGEVGGTRTTFLDAFLPTSAETTVNFYADNPEGGNHIYFYKQNADGEGYTLANTVNTTASSFNLSDKYNGFKCVAWNTSSDTSNWNIVGELMNRNGQYYYDANPNNAGYQTASIGSNGLYVYFDRKDYPILFYDGAYVDGNGNPVVEMDRGELYVKENITYGENISDYLGEPAEDFIPVGYVFDGWHTDDAGTTLYSGSTMPEGGLTLYAKWRPIQYRVFLHPNALMEDGTKDETLDWGSTNQAMTFRVNYGGKISTPTGIRSGYQFVGWFYENGDSFDKAFAINDTNENLTSYDKTVDFTDPMDKWGEGATSNSDIVGNDGGDRFWITKKLDLYAKWRKILEGAEGMTIIYDANGGSKAPEDRGLYVDLASAIAGAASTPSDTINNQFKYWIVQTWDKSEEKYVNTNPEVIVNPGESFTVHKEYAKVVVNKYANDEGEECTVGEDCEGKTGYDNISSATYTIKLIAEYGPKAGVETTTIEYYDPDNLVYTWTGDVNEPLTITGAIEKDGYTFKEWNTDPEGLGKGFEAGTGVSADNEDLGEEKVNKLYAIRDINSYAYTVHYFYEGVEDETKMVEGTGDFESKITEVEDKNIEGYKWEKTETLPLTISSNESANVINVYYVNRNDLSYTVNYLDKGNNNIAIIDAKTVSGQTFGTQINSANEKVEISGYNYDSVSPETLTIAVENNVINVYYTKKNDLSYVVHYYEQGTTNSVTGDKIEENQTFGESVTETAIDVDGYNKFGDISKTITIAEEGNEIIFYYEKRNDLSYTIYYKDRGTNSELTGAKIVSGQTFGESVTEIAIDIEGYNSVEPTSAEIEITAGTNEHTFYYTAATNTAYTVKYYKQNIDRTDYENYKTESENGTTNETATVNPGTIEGFTLNNEKSTLTGIIAANGSLVLEVYYDRVESTITIDPNCTGDECENPTVETGSYEKEITLPAGERSYTLSYDVNGNQNTVDPQTVTAIILGYCKGVTTCDENVRIAVDAPVKIEATPVTYYAVWSDTLTVTVADGSDYQTDDKNYTFVTWKDGETSVDPESTLTLSGDKELVAKYTDEARKYTITFVDEDGTKLQSSEVAYGDTPAYSGDPLTKESDNTYAYTFTGWTPSIRTVDGPQVYTAVYSSEFINYKVTFNNEDGSPISEKATYHYGDTVEEPTYPTKDGYKFKAWSPALQSTVTENATYVATYFEDKNDNDIDDSTEPHFTVEFLQGDNGTLNGTTKYENILSGLTFAQAEITVPTINPNENYKVNSDNDGWDKVIVTTVTENATYTAQYFADFNNSGIDDEIEKVVLIFNAGDHGNIEGNNSKEIPDLLPDYDVYPEAPVVTSDVEYVFNERAPTYTSGENIPLTGPVLSFTATYNCAPDYHDQSLETPSRSVSTVLVCVSNTTGGMACVEGNKPANSHFDSKTGTGTWNGTSYDVACPWECDNGYHKDGNSCKANGGGGGGGGSGGSHPDDCPNGDKSGSRYDGTCDAPGGGGSDDEEIELGGQVSDKCSVEGSDRSEEEIAAYLYACENDITTIRDINEARLGDYLNRAEMAKIISVFATKELGMKPNTSKDCSNFAESIESWSQEMKDFMVMSCQLELMGIHTTNYEAIPDFMPAKRVSRAEFGTILSRVLWGSTYEGTNDNYYFRHLDALKANNIITNIDPTITEYRAWVLLMVYRAVEVVKSGNATPKTSVEEQVNEELQEEANAGTGTVAEVETGAVAEVETGTTIGMPNPASVYCEEQGGTVDLDTSKCKLADGTEVDEWEYYRANNKSEEAEVETGSVAEVETGSVTD